MKLVKVVEAKEYPKEQKKIIFDPIPGLQGIEPSRDPLLETRAAVYLIKMESKGGRLSSAAHEGQ